MVEDNRIKKTLDIKKDEDQKSDQNEQSQTNLIPDDKKKKKNKKSKPVDIVKFANIDAGAY